MILSPRADQTKSDASSDRQTQAQAQMSKVSFGALAKAQDALEKNQSADRKRKRGDENSKSQEDKLEALRARLRQIKAEKLTSGLQPTRKSPSAAQSTVQQGSNRTDDDEGDNDNHGSESDSDSAPKARSSKHAPAVQSSKRMVSRKRNVVDVKKPVFRDPRFDNVSGPRPDENTVGKRYSFLNDYRVSEIADLRQAIKKTKSEDEKEKLKKKLLSMESQQKARENKEKQQDVIRDHRKKEKELVKQGKQPFYLKKCTFFTRGSVFSKILTVLGSRAKEDCFDRPIPEHEVQAA